MIWVLLFLGLGDDRPPRVVHEYKTQAQCEQALADVIKATLATEDELKCAYVRKDQIK